MLLPFLAIVASQAVASTKPDPAPAPPIPGYTLVFSDDFDGDRLDPGRWKPWALGPRRDAVNTADAAKVDGQGYLVITTSVAPAPATSSDNAPPAAPVIHTGGVWTKDIFEPTFGYFEARIKFHDRLGHWGAFWLNCGGMGSIPGNPHETGVEMDVIEFHHKMKGKDGLYRAQQTLHWDGYGKDHKSKGHTPVVQSLADDFHTYGLLWTNDEYVFFIDGVETWRVREKDGGAISHRPEYLILSLEVGDWAGKINLTDLPDSMLVDWVRVWQEPPPESGSPQR
ncbi:MAG: Glucan endo-1,3-beta-glucosidase A1 [Phycisphaerales bacterium]|nr:Glucan endo-1,3-beta-glucosidase A1 [Phycisphaerales bacterium]